MQNSLGHCAAPSTARLRFRGAHPALSPEQARWEADRGFEEHRYSDTCWRGFFEDTRAKRVYSHVEKVYTARGSERR